MEQQNKQPEPERRGTSALTRLLAPRGVKYRAWLPEKNIMRPVTNIHFGDEGEALTITFEVTSESKFYNEFVHGENGYLLEFTGLKDKKGKKIYEGDILQSNTKRFVAKWKGAGFKLCGIGNRGWATTSTESTKIIGNIFENPELIP